MYSVDLADNSDINDTMKMCELFHSKSGYKDIVEFDNSSMLKTVKHLISDKDGILYIAKLNNKAVGMIGALLYPFYFNSAHKTGQELFWWVDGDHRKTGVGAMLLDAVEKEATKRGAKSFVMIALESLNPEIVGEIYIGRGYIKSDHSYMRSL